MSDNNSPRVSYETSQELMNRLRYTAETLSLECTRWDEPYVTGPSLYFLLVADVNFGAYTDPLGANRWPVELCPVVFRSVETFTEAAREVAFNRDGAVIIAADGTIQEQMVRVRTPNATELDKFDSSVYADWMGTKHMSALEASTRLEVLWAVTLSEEDGRVTTFRDGTYKDYPRVEIGGRWRPG